MLVYCARRLLWLAPLLLGLSLLTFGLMHAVPGGPWDQEKPLEPEAVENLNRRYGLDKPWWEQYGRYLWNAVHGELGPSYINQDRDVREIIADGLPRTVTLGLTAFALSLLVGVPLGVLAAVRRNSAIDYISVLLATIFSSVPSFVLAIFLMVLFAVELGWLPSGGWGSVRHLVLPAVALAALPAAYTARVVRASMLDALRQDYVRTAQAKGLAQGVIYRRHVLRNAFIPVLTVLGPELAFLVTGSFIIETVFSIPGTGRLFVQGVLQRDYSLVMGMVLFYAAIVALLNLLVDVLYGVFDPRVRVQS
ncbi:MAG: ABC transporter permease [Chloroflexi bacterium]|nr:ABC transporter permease [Chloroflexota bacterium]